MVWDIVRDSTFGHLVRLASRGKYFQYAEERDPSLLKQFINEDKSLNIRHHGDTNAPENESEAHRSERSSRTQLSEDETTQSQYNGSHRRAVDPEKGTDKNVIDWVDPADPDNPRNWSTVKKFFVTFEICFLTFSVYIGSAIYTAGIQDVVRVFGVSQVAATVGLTLYVSNLLANNTNINSFTDTSPATAWGRWYGPQ
jgi:DHA1 family multidrug resistance protein-like MFS transporter